MITQFSKQAKMAYMEPVIEPVSDMEEEEANKDEAESKNKQLFTCLMLVIVPG